MKRISISKVLILCYTIIVIITLLLYNAFSVKAEVAPLNNSDTYTYKMPDLDLAVTVSNDLVGFTQNTTPNNSYLEKIGASDVEQVRALLMVNNIYLELIPKEGDITYEILVSGKNAPSQISNFNEVSDDVLKGYFDEYIVSANTQKNEETNIKETITDSYIEKLNGTNYFVTEVTSVSGNLVTVYLKKYYTVMQGKAVTFTLQTNQETLTPGMSQILSDIINTADYKPIKKSIFDNPFLIEITTSFLSLLLFAGFLALILFIIIKANKRKKKY